MHNIRVAIAIHIHKIGDAFGRGFGITARYISAARKAVGFGFRHLDRSVFTIGTHGKQKLFRKHRPRPGGNYS